MNKQNGMEVIFTRHTSTNWDQTGRIKGQTDIPLNIQGKVEAEKLAGLLSNLNIHFIVSSDLKRASETAKIISCTLSARLQLEPKLRECSFGKIEGLTKQQAIKKYGPQVTPNLDDQYESYDFRPFGGENRDAVLARHLEVFYSIVNRKSGNTVLVVGHTRGLSTLLAGIGQSPNFPQNEYRKISYT